MTLQYSAYNAYASLNRLANASSARHKRACTIDRQAILLLLTALTTSYLIGCLNSAYYLTRIIKHRDIRSEHSGNAGATNAGRILGRSGFIAVLIIDILRGYYSIKLGNYITSDPSHSALLLFFTILGHIYPIQLGFRGGKGAASIIGGVGAISFILCGVFIAFFCLIYLITRNMTFAGIITFILFPIGCYAIGEPLQSIIILSSTILLILYTYYRTRKPRAAHRNNQ